MPSSSTLRILFVADLDRNPNSGAAGTEWQTLEALRRRGHRIDEIWADGLPHRIAHWNLHYVFELPRAYEAAIAAKFRAQPYDVVHVNQAHCWLAAREHLRCRRPGVLVHRSHGLDDHMEEVLRSWRRGLGVRSRSPLNALPGWFIDRRLAQHGRWAARYAAGTIVSSSGDAEYLVEKRQVPPDRVACIPQAPAPAFRQVPLAPWSPARLKRLLHVGGFTFAKGIHALARAVSDLLLADAEATFTWVVPSADHARAVGMLDARVLSRVRLIGWVAQEELVEIYDRHGVFLFPSLFEGFGKVFLEAMARGLCVVGTPTGGMRDVLRPGANGALVPFNSAADVVAAVRNWWNNPEHAARISAAAAQTAAEYSWERVGAETESFYEKLLSQSSGRRTP